MATLTFAYNHARDPMNPDDLGDKIAAALSLNASPAVTINTTQIIVTHANIAAGNTAAIQAVIDAYNLDSNRANLPAGGLGTLMNKARLAIDVNNTFLAIGSPSNAQVLTQVQRLTRENTGLIKILLNQVDDLSGT